MNTQFDFVRSHGLGNDYLVMDPARLGFELTPEFIRLICHRNLGVGSDGILVVHKNAKANFAVRIFNPDGSEAEKSGNGLRIFSKFLYDHGYTNETEFTIQTLGGMVNTRLILEKGRVVAVRVDMGRAAGHTFASGSSACAVATACFDKKLVVGRVTVQMEGGNLTIEIDKDLNLVMTGPVEEICTGKLSEDLRRRLGAVP